MLTGCQTLGEIFERGHWGLKVFLLMTAVGLVAKEHVDHSPNVVADAGAYPHGHSRRRRDHRWLVMIWVAARRLIAWMPAVQLASAPGPRIEPRTHKRRLASRNRKSPGLAVIGGL